MSNPIQNFYKSTITQDWSIGPGNFYVSVKPSTSVGRLVVSPSSDSLREIIEYTSTGTDGNGDYIVISVRGVGGTTEQSHTVGEKVRMNITAEDWEDMRDDIDSIVAAGAPNASITTRGIVQIATQSEVDAGTNTGSTSAILVITPTTLGITGLISPYAGSTAPNGWLLCNGSAVSRTTYSNLFSLISTTYGVGDNSTTFNIPDLRGRVAVGKSTDTEFDTLGETGGEKTHQLTIPEMPSHSHDAEVGSNGSSVHLTDNFYNGGSNDGYTPGFTGGDTAHNNLQPYLTINYIIKY